MTYFDILIVGGGHAGAQAASALRQNGFTGSVAIVGDEDELPYDRPPLSKEYLSGTKAWDRLLLRTPEGWAERSITMLPGKRVLVVDPVARLIETQGGMRIAYDTLIWATGGVPRRLTCDGGNTKGVYTVRNRTDVDDMIAQLPSVSDVVVIGGGYIGLEAAAVLRKLGRQVAVLEAQDRVLARVAGEPLSRFYEGEHRAQGVDLRLGVTVDCIEHSDGHATGVRLATGEFLPAQMVIVGIGIVPAIEPLAKAGADVGNGVRVDENCRTSLPHIYAIGDCAEHRNIWAEKDWMRLESVQNANDQAITAAKAICGNPEPYRAVPWFWSDQYDLRLQTVGLSRGYDDLVVRGEPSARSFSLVYLRKGSVIALDCVNATRDYVQGRLLVSREITPELEALANPNIPLKSLAV